MPFIHGSDAHDIHITGPGTIRGGGRAWHQACGLRYQGAHPRHCILLQRCRDIVIDGPTLRDSVIWTCKLEDCQNAVIRHLTIRNPTWVEAQCADGIDIVCCQDVLIEHCDIETGDDAICIKSHKGEAEFADQPCNFFQPVERITVRDCILASNCSAAKIGTETAADISEVHFERLRIRMHSGAIPDPVPGNPRPSCACVAALAVYSIDGAHINHISFTDCHIEHCAAPIHVQLQRRTSKTSGPIGSIKNIRFHNIYCEIAETAAIIEGDGAQVGAVIINHIDATCIEAAGPIAIPPLPTGRHPSCRKYNHLPAFGLWTRGAPEVSIINSNFNDAGNSKRPSIKQER